MSEKNNENELERGSAAQAIWERYYDRLVRLARRNLRDARRDADEEDVVQSAFNSFFQAAAKGRFPDIADQTGLWKVLVTITLRKVSKRHRRSTAAKRGGGQVRGESVFGDDVDAGDANPGIGNAAFSDEPTPEIALEMTETLEVMLRELPGDDLREITLMKLEGFQNKEIAAKLDVVELTISRKLRRIRECWDKQLTQDTGGDV